MASGGAGGMAGRVCVLAGGSGGIGSRLAHRLHGEGAPLVIGYRRESARAEALAADLARAGTAAVRLVGGDLAEESTRLALIEAACGLGAPYGLVVLAGDPARPRGGVATQEEMDASLQTNYTGPVLLARAFAERVAAARSGGSIVLLSTMQALAPFAGSLSYAAPKVALTHAALLLAKEWGGENDVCVNVVAPGVTAAGMAEASIRSGKYDRFVSDGVIRRFGRAEDVVRAIRFLLEPDGYVTGQVLAVDGGLVLRRDLLQR